MSDHSTKPEGWDLLGEHWRKDEQRSAFVAVDPDVVRARAARFARTIRWRNLREVISGHFVVLAGAGIAYHASSPYGRFGGVSLAIGASIVVAVIVRRTRNLLPPPPDAPTCEVMAFERSELERQAHLLERAWLWYLAPFVPSIVAIYAGAARVALSRPEHGGSLPFVGLLFVATAGVLVLVGWLNVRAARSLRRRMVALPPEDMGRD